MCGAILDTTAQAASLSIQPNDSRKRGQANAQMIENALLVWLDGNIDEDSSDCQNTITHFRRIVNALKVFIDDGECIKFLEKMTKAKVYMIISGALGQNIVPRLHNLSQIDSIFIFCRDKTYHEGWAKQWSKIKGVYTEIKLICDALEEAVQPCEQNAVSISAMDTSDLLSNNSFSQLDPSFMYTQILKEILLTIDFKQQHIDEFVEYCRQALDGNPTELKYVDQLSREYRKKTPIWWYTLESFLYKMVNRALRMMDVDLVVKSGFFIVDLHRQIEQLHREEFSSSHQKFTVYRGQGMEKAEFEKMMASKGRLLSFNYFLSTSKTRQISQNFAEHALQNPQLVGVLFVMTIDPSLSDTPFASVAQDDSLLFSMNTVFRIEKIKQLVNHPRLFKVKLSMTTDKDDDLRMLMDRIREETLPAAEGWYRLGLFLNCIGESATAQQVFEVLLKQKTEETDREPIYNKLGIISDKLGKYDEAIGYYEKSIGIKEKQNPYNHMSLACSYNNIGSVYISMGDYPKALLFHEKALAIQQQSLPPNHPRLASSHNSIGSVYISMGDYPKALLFHEKALAIQQQSLPPNHPSLASSHNDMGAVHEHMKNYSKALLCYERAMNIAQRSLPPNHPDLQKYENDLTRVKTNLE